MISSKARDTDLNLAIKQYVLTAVAAKPTLQSVTWAVSQRQTSELWKSGGNKPQDKAIHTEFREPKPEHCETTLS